MSLENKASPVWFFPLSADNLFCDLRPDSQKSLAAIKRQKRFRKETVVFAAGELPCCIYILLNGQAQILLNADLNIFRPVRPAEIFGLTETSAGRPFEIMLQTITPCVFELIENDDLLRFLLNEPEICFRLVKSLDSNLQKCGQLFSSSIN